MMYRGGMKESSQPTYEELKLAEGQGEPAAEGRSQPTYEELKPPNR